ncbi:MAG TPA: MmcQ/YjbR family DNA-binding protein [Propionicimonas sp.]|nr:MmcQ/YjbR family DNA-binding protein [Propionicimonas sp.]
MTHPRMFDDDDPTLARVRRIALALPEAAEKISHGRPAFYTRKIFAYYGGSRKVDGEWRQHPRSVMLLADLDGQSALRAMPGAYVPGYLGPYGWTGLDLDARTDWDDLADLILESYLFTAPAALRRQFD